ncbi:uncharacterized protein LOC134837613 [Culicoides brevitarsis]|uniref:uncharacterized protein LOC134837613 n=1 Tax=Culicoides brevitarsis TaxID=469753 RepID=UPI00307BD7B7
MSPKKDVNGKKASLTEIEKDFQNFFQDCSTSGLSKFQLLQVLFPLKVRKWKNPAIKYGIIGLVIVLVVLVAFYVDFFAWHLAALGRITLGHVRSVWNWEDLYRAKCLISGKMSSKENGGSQKMANTGIDFKDCAVCENIDKILRISNTSYNFLHDKYLLRSAPVIITDVNHHWTPSQTFPSYLLSLPDLTFSHPCELQTNLLFKSTDLRTLLHLASQATEYFLHFRNCDFEAVKASRSFIRKPYFYSPHLEPPYTSWILMSQNYPQNSYKSLSFLNLVIVQQLQGILEATIEAKDACFEVCGRHHVQLAAGEALVLMSKLWSFKYLPASDVKNLSVTVVTETHFL